MTYRDFLLADIRLVILRILNELPGYRANSSILSNALERFGHTQTRDQVKTQLMWLAEQGLVTVETVGPVIVADLTERGGDIATGRATVPGVSRPRAGG